MRQVGQGLAKPSRNLVLPVTLEPLFVGKPIPLVLHVVLQELPNPRSGAEGVVPVEENQGPKVGKRPGQGLQHTLRSLHPLPGIRLAEHRRRVHPRRHLVALAGILVAGAAPVIRYLDRQPASVPQRFCVGRWDKTRLQAWILSGARLRSFRLVLADTRPSCECLRRWRLVRVILPIHIGFDWDCMESMVLLLQRSLLRYLRRHFWHRCQFRLWHRLERRCSVGGTRWGLPAGRAVDSTRWQLPAGRAVDSATASVPWVVAAG
mmetsp:Transcript_1967/g.5735  ORF Transcript_1967/g.5735 Transcript_1967/m.5735 type:complete len:263 (+) Transcript_1967:973-1761(+)